MADRFHFERECIVKGFRKIAGLDEAGRGPLAGPVVVAAVILPAEWIEIGLPKALKGLNDSKSISPNRRQDYFDFICANPEIDFAISAVSAGEIDSTNILQATHEGMIQAISKLSQIDHVLVDGLFVKTISLPQTAIVKGDCKSYSIAAASVLAKVHRDFQMKKLDKKFPEYEFAQHKGYPTKAHLAALKRFGACPIHRRSFAPVRNQQRKLL